MANDLRWLEDTIRTVHDVRARLDQISGLYRDGGPVFEVAMSQALAALDGCLEKLKWLLKRRRKEGKG